MKTKDAPGAELKLLPHANLERTYGRERKHPLRVASVEGTPCDLLGLSTCFPPPRTQANDITHFFFERG